MIALFRKLGWLMRRRSKEEELAAELQFHLEQETAERQAAGMSTQEARGAARRELETWAWCRKTLAARGAGRCWNNSSRTCGMGREPCCAIPPSRY